MQVEKNVDIVTIAGTRPEIIKLSGLVRLLGNSSYNHALLYTGQHFSETMKDVFFDELGISPQFDLKCNTSDVHSLKVRVVALLKHLRPKYVIVYGDTYSTMAGALAALDIGAKLIHLEAGIRDLDTTIPEERVRMHVDSVSDNLMAPTELAKTFLSYEGITRNVFVTGNLIVDVCRKMAKIADEHKVRGIPERFLLLTMHRQENVDDPSNLELLRRHLSKLNQKVVFPIHPRTRNNLAKYEITLPPNVIPIDAVGYLEFLYLLKNCDLVMTDSGGVTEESIILKKPCITLRHSTARWETILLKANVLFPLFRRDSLNTVVESMLEVDIRDNPYGEDVASRMTKLVEKIAAS
ncbi:MAG: UDP-N-acetylglucosamine 2-epimerase (non-hydrolyzing) [Nitrososphaera sp.]|nr:UDP-N-acetylglucosamine 2-epimerase (non-hydrolyzing) [Nitrososphaera sp.]